MAEIKLHGSVVPQYDVNGFDSGLFIVYAVDFAAGIPIKTPLYENIVLALDREGNVLVGQYDWDGESYEIDGSIDATFTDLGKYKGENPFGYGEYEAAGKLLDFLENSREAVNII